MACTNKAKIGINRGSKLPQGLLHNKEMEIETNAWLYVAKELPMFALPEKEGEIALGDGADIDTHCQTSKDRIKGEYLHR